ASVRSPHWFDRCPDTWHSRRLPLLQPRSPHVPAAAGAGRAGDSGLSAMAETTDFAANGAVRRPAGGPALHPLCRGAHRADPCDSSAADSAAPLRAVCAAGRAGAAAVRPLDSITGVAVEYTWRTSRAALYTA